MSESTKQQRENWKKFECNRDAMQVIDFGPDRIRVAPGTADAFHALAAVLLSHGYDIRVDDTDSYNCRPIKGGTGHSLHSYGIAVDINWNTNPFKMTPDNREVRFSDKPTQQERAHDVKLGLADTDMTPEMIDDVHAIMTNNHKTVFEWGGNWHDRKDAMHFELDVSPADLETGIDWSTVKQSRSSKAQAGEAPVPAPAPTTGQLAIGSRGESVRELQTALAHRGFPVGDIDGIYGTQTAGAVRAFQAAQGLPASGIADQETLRRLTGPVAQKGGGMMQAEDILRAIFGAVLGTPPSAPVPPVPPPPANQPAGTASTQAVLQILLNAIMGRQPGALQAGLPVVAAGTTTTTTTTDPSTAPAILSPIDKWLGGEALAGKKTLLAIIAYVVMYFVQMANDPATAALLPGNVDPNHPWIQSLMTVIMGIGGLGVTAKVDRATKALGVIAAKPPAPTP
jgi:peptidoglycan hydrolase-like protein with peptidoglycan-binding domain